MDSYQTINGRFSAEIEEKKSRFIAAAAHVESEEEALAFLEEVRSTHRMARHNVYAYVLRDGGRIRYSDDGEPQKTAGLPVLEAIRHAGLVDVIVVVTRYFGGTLLGTGGLVRAYTQATQAVLEDAERVEVSRCIDVEFGLPYALYDQIQSIAERLQAKVIDSDFAEEVRLRLRVLEGDQGELVEKISELSRGRVSPQVSEPFDAVF